MTPSGTHTCSRQGGQCLWSSHAPSVLQVSCQQLHLLVDSKAMVPSSAMLHTPSEINPVQTSRGSQFGFLGYI